MPTSQSPGLLAESARLDRAFFENASFPCRMNMPVRFDELDVLGHVNNAAGIAMLQEARIAFYHMMGLPKAGNAMRTVVGGLIVEFAREITYPGEVVIGSGIASIGRTSYTFAQALRQNGSLAVCARTTMILTDDSGTAPIPAQLEAALRERCMIAMP